MRLSACCLVRPETFLAMGCLTGAFASISAQTTMPRESGPVGFEIYAGAARSAYDMGEDGSRLGPIAGLRLSYRVNTPVHITADLSYAQFSDIGSHAAGSYLPYDDRWLVATGGVEGVVSSGRTGYLFGIGVGAAWRRLSAGDPVGSTLPDPYAGDPEWSPVDVLAWSIGVRQRLSSRASVVLRARALSMDVIESGGRLTPAFTVGLSFR